MGTFPSLSRSERAPHKITTAAVRAQDQFLSTVDAIGRPRFNFTSLNRPREFANGRGRGASPVRRRGWSWGVLSAPRGHTGARSGDNRVLLGTRGGMLPRLDRAVTRAVCCTFQPIKIDLGIASSFYRRRATAAPNRNATNSEPRGASRAMLLKMLNGMPRLQPCLCVPKTQTRT